MTSKIYFQFALNFGIMLCISTFCFLKFTEAPTWVRTGIAALMFTDVIFLTHSTFTGFKRKKAGL